jgi:hypothetical protein
MSPGLLSRLITYRRNLAVVNYQQGRYVISSHRLRRDVLCAYLISQRIDRLFDHEQS